MKLTPTDEHLPPGLLVLFMVHLLFLLCLPAWGTEAQDEVPDTLMQMEIEDLTRMKVATVTGASRYEQKVTRAPSDVTIVTADQIKKYGYRTLADLIRSVRGFYTYSDRTYTYVGVRGFGLPGDFSTRVLVLVDGHRLNDNIYDEAPFGNEVAVDIDLIDRVEVIRGPGSSLYGSNAFFAVINVITRSGSDLAGGEVSGSAASFDTYKGRLSYGNEFGNGVDALVSGSLLRSHGPNLYYREFDDPAHNHGVANGIDYERAQNLFTKLSFHDLVLEGVYMKRPKGVGTAWYGVDFNDPRNEVIDTRYYLDAKYEKSSGKYLDVMTRVYYDSYMYDATSIYGGAPNIDNMEADWVGGEVKVATKSLDRHLIIAGAEFQDNLHRILKNYNVDPYLLNFYVDRQSNNWAVYLQDECTIFDSLILNAGIRYDYYQEFGSSTNPRLALIYTPIEQSSIKLLYGSAFRVPNMWETSYALPFVTKGNNHLSPEHIKTYEVVYEQYLGKHLKATATGFYYKITRLIQQETDPADNLLVYLNSGAADSRGAELELEGTWPGGWEGRASYSYQDTRDSQSGDRLLNSAAHLAKGNLIVPLMDDKLFAGVEEQYASGRKTPAGRVAASYALTNATIYSRNLLPGLELSGSLYNLFDRRYADPSAPGFVQDVFPMDGRTFRVKLTYKF